jgi:hypothetical protein
MPEITRPVISPGNAGQARNTMPDAMLTPSAAATMRRRPSQSEMCPARNRLAMTPTA